MASISELEQEIRDFINNPRKRYALLQQPAAWNMLCSCLDLIGDTEIAIAAFDRSVEPKDVGEKYLLIYGILQGLFLQQDAVRNLCEALKINYIPDPILDDIRKIRNDSIGHPTKRGGGQGESFNFISRISLSKSGFELITTYPDGQTPLFRRINVSSLIESQQQILHKALSDVLDKLQKEEADHKAMFKSERLQNNFPLELHYYFEKVYEDIFGNKPSEFGSIHMKLIIESIESFKLNLERRGILKAYDSITYLLGLLEYPLEQLSLYFADMTASTLNDKSAYIFAFFIEKHIDNLKKIAKEIDDEYDTKSEGNKF